MGIKKLKVLRHWWNYFLRMPTRIVSVHLSMQVDIASSLYCLIGKRGYELPLADLGFALPSITSIQRMVASR